MVDERSFSDVYERRLLMFIKLGLLKRRKAKNKKAKK